MVITCMTLIANRVWSVTVGEMVLKEQASNSRSDGHDDMVQTTHKLVGHPY